MSCSALWRGSHESALLERLLPQIARVLKINQLEVITDDVFEPAASILRGRQPKLTPKQDASVARHLDAGELTIAEIGAPFNLSRASVYQAAERHRARSASGSLNSVAAG